jgi:DNA-binding transcriptional ArsR family regulator
MVKYLPDPLAETFAALANPTRRVIVERLTQGETPVSALAEPHDLTLPAILKHLAVLERAGLIARQKRGRVSWCRLNPTPLRDAAMWLAHYQPFWESQFAALTAYLEERPPAGVEKDEPDADPDDDYDPAHGGGTARDGLPSLD